MNDSREEQSGEGSGGRFHILQPLRDLESNWAVDLAKNLEEYLLKICSGEITSDNEHLSVNFAEAALLLQGSTQVYSRKVEYLYSLVLHALEFISQKRQEDQPEKTSIQADGIESHTTSDEENEPFLGLDDVPVEAKNCLTTGLKNDDLDHFVKPPANLVVLEGDCLDTSGDAGELGSYLLATSDLYQDFLLLDPCDAVAINNFLKGDQTGIRKNVFQRDSLLRSKTRRSFQSPTRRSGGTARRSSFGQSHDANFSQNPEVEVNCNFDVNDNNTLPNPPACDVPDNDHDGYKMNSGHSELGDSDEDENDDDDDDDDPWKPLNPHEPGNLRVKPFKKVKVFRRQGISSTKKISLTTEFPQAKLHGTISPEFAETWEARFPAFERLRESQSPSLYEKLRKSLVLGGHETCNAFGNPEDENENHEHDYIPDFEEDDVNMPETTYMDTEVPLCNEKDGDDAVHFESDEAFGKEDPNAHASLEDLCRSHLDALLASIAETEQQSELAARVSTWKSRIEHTLEEQDSRPPFDIHEYGGRVLDKLSLEADSGGVMSFADIVNGQHKHDVARTFSALLQLVNNGNVDLDRGNFGGESVCYTAVNPFHVRLLSHDNRHKEVQLRSSKKRVKSPLTKGCMKGDGDKLEVKQRPKFSSSSGFTSQVNSSHPSGKVSVKLGRVNGVRCTPDGKRRRRSRLIEPVDLHSAG